MIAETKSSAIVMLNRVEMCLSTIQRFGRVNCCHLCFQMMPEKARSFLEGQLPMVSGRLRKAKGSESNESSQVQITKNLITGKSNQG